ncbi:hypothetical protein GMA8713_04415 [Grimontia marina]|uniref:Uncharacterized protein n=1 Tax=Grimontia marina TaxID=646534 RepID=A0A128FJD1_9GAMM|nr:hypothetical protein GMA8713_04415 [Grimontia marina]
MKTQSKLKQSTMLAFASVVHMVKSIVRNDR